MIAETTKCPKALRVQERGIPDVLKIRPQWVNWRYVSSGELKAARVGRSVRIHLPSLREFMEHAADDSRRKGGRHGLTRM